MSNLDGIPTLIRAPSSQSAVHWLEGINCLTATRAKAIKKTRNNNGLWFFSLGIPFVFLVEGLARVAERLAAV